LDGSLASESEFTADLFRRRRRWASDAVRYANRSIAINRYGLAGNDGRDADLIVAAARKAGVSKIDFVLVTHVHSDHVGGSPQLAARIPIGTFIDHGENRENSDAPTVQVWQAYEQLLATQKYKRITANPGDRLPIQGIEAAVISSDGAVIGAPLPGAGQDNPKCKDANTFPRIRQKTCVPWGS
jgi:competence protein ComEC